MEISVRLAYYERRSAAIGRAVVADCEGGFVLSNHKAALGQERERLQETLSRVRQKLDLDRHSRSPPNLELLGT